MSEQDDARDSAGEPNEVQRKMDRRIDDVARAMTLGEGPADLRVRVMARVLDDRRGPTAPAWPFAAAAVLVLGLLGAGWLWWNHGLTSEPAIREAGGLSEPRTIEPPAGPRPAGPLTVEPEARAVRVARTSPRRETARTTRIPDAFRLPALPAPEPIAIPELGWSVLSVEPLEIAELTYEPIAVEDLAGSALEEEKAKP